MSFQQIRLTVVFDYDNRNQAQYFYKISSQTDEHCAQGQQLLEKKTQNISKNINKKKIFFFNLALL